MTNLFLSSLFFTLLFVIAQWSQVMTGKKLQCLLKPWLRMASFICFCSKLIPGPAQIQEMKMQTAHLDERNSKIVLQRGFYSKNEKIWPYFTTYHILLVNLINFWLSGPTLFTSPTLKKYILHLVAVSTVSHSNGSTKLEGLMLSDSPICGKEHVFSLGITSCFLRVILWSSFLFSHNSDL